MSSRDNDTMLWFGRAMVVVPRRTDRRGVGIRVARRQVFLPEADCSTEEGIMFVGEIVLR
jgi:hypothetical protein